MSRTIAQRCIRLAQCKLDPREQAIEYKRCKDDVVYFVNNWVWTYDPRLGDGDTDTPSNIPFLLFPLQEAYLRWRNDRQKKRENGVIEKSRDMGLTWLNVVWHVWRWLFHRGYKGTFGSRKEALVDDLGNPDSIFEKIRMVLRTLPDFFLPKGFKEKVHATFLSVTNPENGNTITGEGGDNMGRGGRSSVYDVDETAFVERPNKVIAAVSNNSNVIFWTSTPNGVGNPFYQMRHGGKIQVFTFHWRFDPRKDEAWYQKQLDTYDSVTVAQEVDIDYHASVDGVVVLKRWIDQAIARGAKLGLYPSERSAVSIGVDVAIKGSDKSAAVVREGRNILWGERWAGHDTQESTDRLVGLGKDVEGALEGDEPLHFFIDVIGVGRGVFDALRRWVAKHRPGKWRVHPVQVGELSPEKKCKRLRDALWWRVRAFFEHQAPAISPDIDQATRDQLAAELSLVTYDIKEDGLVVVISKRELKKQGIASPDLADALIHTFHWEALKPKKDDTARWAKKQGGGRRRGIVKRGLAA